MAATMVPAKAIIFVIGNVVGESTRRAMENSFSLCFLNLYLQPRLRRAGIVLVLLIGCSLVGCAATSAPSAELFVEAPLPSDSEEFGFVKTAKPLRSIGKVKVLVIFAKFKDEQGSDLAPDDAEKLLDPDYEGSFAHFYRTMSFGQLEVGGAVLPKRYSSDRPRSAYLADAQGGRAVSASLCGRFFAKLTRMSI